MLGPGIRTPLLDRMSVQLQFTLGNAGVALCVDYHLGEQEDFILYHCYSTEEVLRFLLVILSSNE
jgi:hypothetical protein